MSSMIQQSIDSHRYLGAGGKLECVCCGSGIFARDGFCPKCQAPVSISKTVHQRGVPAQFLPVLGASNAGKTVYLGMLLDILTKGVGQLQGLPNNSLSVAVQEQTVNALEQQRFPEKTPNDVDQWKWMHCELNLNKKKKQFFDIISPDFAGEAIAYELEQPGSFSIVNHLVEQANGMLLLIDSLRVRDAGSEEDFFAMKVATYVHGLRSQDSRRNKKIKSPLAIVLTKTDSCSEANDDPATFANSNMPGFVRFLNRHFTTYEFFASSVVGSSATLVDHHGRLQEIPFHVAPQGILEPIEWLIKNV